MVRRTQQEADRRQAWDKNARYFDRSNVETTKQRVWGSRESYEERWAQESNKLHNISLYSMILLSHASSYLNVLLLNFFHTKFVCSFVPQDLKDVLNTYANLLGYKVHTVTNLSLLIVGNSGISFCRKEELLLNSDALIAVDAWTISCILVKIVSHHIFIEPVNDLAYYKSSGISLVSVRDGTRTGQQHGILFNLLKLRQGSEIR